MSRFSNSNFRSLNESIQNLNANNRITELEEYVDMLESVITSIAEQMQCDTDELVEMAMTPARKAEHEYDSRQAGNKANRAHTAETERKHLKRKADIDARASREGKSKTLFGSRGRKVGRAGTSGYIK